MEFGSVVQLVRTLACHARGRRFEPVPGRQLCLCSSVGRAEDWKSSCRWFDSDRRHQGCGCSSSGRAPPCQGGGSEFEPRHPLQSKPSNHAGCWVFCCGNNYRLCRWSVKSFSDETDKKTPFGVEWTCGLATARDTKRRTFKKNDNKSLAHTSWNCKYHIVLAIVYWITQIQWYIEREK